MFSGLNCLPVIVGEPGVQILTLNTSYQRKETSKLRKSPLAAVGRRTVGRETAGYQCYAGYHYHQNQQTGNVVKTRGQDRLHVDH